MPFIRAPFFQLVFADAASRLDANALAETLARTLVRGPGFPVAVLEAAGRRFEALGDRERARTAYRAAALVEPGLGAALSGALRNAERPNAPWNERLAILERAADPLLSEILSRQTHVAFGNTVHYAALEGIAQLAKPDTYLEIGSNNGLSLERFRGARRMVAVDPELYFDPASFPNLEFHQETSDSYFARTLAQADRPVPDVVFIDGLHESDQVVRDFVHAERMARPGALVMLHDVVPIDPRCATKDRRTKFWLGDCWRALHFIAHHRPDLKMAICPVLPSGLALIRLGDAPGTLPVDAFAEHAEGLHLERDLAPLLLRMRWVEPSWASVSHYFEPGSIGRTGYERFAFSQEDSQLLGISAG